MSCGAEMETTLTVSGLHRRSRSDLILVGLASTPHDTLDAMNYSSSRYLGSLGLVLVLSCAGAKDSGDDASDVTSTKLHGDYTVTCTTTEKIAVPEGEDAINKVTFVVRNIDRPEVTLDGLEDGEAVVAEPKDNSYLSTLNENIGVGNEDGKLTIDGDGDGFLLVDLVLYEDSGFKSGYVKVTDGGEGMGDQYSTVKCTLSAAPDAPETAFRPMGKRKCLSHASRNWTAGTPTMITSRGRRSL